MVLRSVPWEQTSSANFSWKRTSGVVIVWDSILFIFSFVWCADGRSCKVIIATGINGLWMRFCVLFQSIQQNSKREIVKKIIIKVCSGRRMHPGGLRRAPRVVRIVGSNASNLGLGPVQLLFVFAITTDGDRTVVSICKEMVVLSTAANRRSTR